MVLLSFIPTLVFWPSILSSSSIKQRQEKTGTPAAQAQEQKPPLETFIDSLDQALSKLGNKSWRYWLLNHWKGRAWKEKPP